MATSLRDLVNAALEAACEDDMSVGEAAAALGASARLLDRLVEYSERAKAMRTRDNLIHSLARPCERAARIWPIESGRPDALLGAAFDAVGVFRDQLSADDRWALALRTGTIARRAAELLRTTGPYEHAPTLKLAVAAADNLRRSGANNPPNPDAFRSFDSPIPMLSPGPSMQPATTAIEHAASLVHELNQPGSGPLTIAQIIAAARAGEALAHALDVEATNASDDSCRIPAGLSDAWRELRESLSCFTDGHPRPHRDDRIIHSAVCLSQALNSLSSSHGAQPLGVAAPSVRTWLPKLGAGIEWQWYRLERAPLIPPGHGPVSEARVSEWLTRSTFVSGRQERAEMVEKLRRVSVEMRSLQPIGDRDGGLRATARGLPELQRDRGMPLL